MSNACDEIRSSPARCSTKPPRSSSNGEAEAARILLRDLVNATVGFEALAVMTNRPAKSLHRMLSRHGNPSTDNLAEIFDALRQGLKVGIEARTVTAVQRELSGRPPTRRSWMLPWREASLVLGES